MRQTEDVALKLAHLSDTHLGFRALSAVDSGVNQRELDVLTSFSKNLNSIAERDPDVIVHSGDFFHVVRPGNNAIIQAYRLLSNLQRKRGGRPFIIVAGNHDTPRSLDSGNILHLFNTIEGVRVFAARAEILEFPDLDLEILTVPNSSIAQKENVAWSPQRGRRYSVLVLHGMESEIAATMKTDGDFEFKATCPDRWTYVALGDVHTHHSFAPNACYAGATDFTSSNVWLEAEKPKGWVFFDSAAGQLEFVPIPTRPFFDLKWIDATGLTAEALELRLTENATWPKGDQLPVIRQVVTSIARETYIRLGIEWRQAIRARCLDYQLETKKTIEAFTARGANSEVGLTLEMEWTRHMEIAQVPPGIDSKKVADTGSLLLKEVEVDEVDPA